MTQGPKRKSNPNQTEKPLFSDKENEIISQELSDAEAYKRNLPVLSDLLYSRPELRRLLYDSHSLLPFLYSIQRDLQAQSTLAGQTADPGRVYDEVVRRLAPTLPPQAVLAFLLPLAKEAKIKKEKRALLWGCADLIHTINQKTPPAESPVIRMVILTSIERTLHINQHVMAFLGGQEPYSFDDQRVADKSYTAEEVRRLFELIAPYEPDFSMSVNLFGLEIYEKLGREVGLRFHQILHFPTVPAKKKARLILMPGETQAPKEEESKEENERRLQATVEALQRDVYFWLYPDFAPTVLSQFRAAAFGKMTDPREAKHTFNAVAYSLLFPYSWSPFLMKLYEISGEKADSFNPPDESRFISAIQSEPDRAEPYRRYADHLYDKQEWRGAMAAYFRSGEILQQQGQEKDEYLQNRVVELNEKIRAMYAVEEIKPEPETEA